MRACACMCMCVHVYATVYIWTSQLCLPTTYALGWNSEHRVQWEMLFLTEISLLPRSLFLSPTNKHLWSKNLTPSVRFTQPQYPTPLLKP